MIAIRFYALEDAEALYEAALESVDELKRRIDEASAQVNVDQLGLAPQCGFASTEEGNELTEADQWAKLARIVEAAEAIWGDVAQS